MKTYIIPTSKAEYLAAKFKRLPNNFEFIFSEKNKERKRLFPDKEVYAGLRQINNLKNKRVVVLHSGAPDPNDGLIELELILQILKDYKIKPELFFSYFPYGRQDKAFRQGETNAAESLIKKLINYYQIKKIYIIDPHFGERDWIKKYPIVSVFATSLLIEKAKKDFGQDILFISPDKGGKRRTGILGLNKKRIDSFRLEYFSSKIVFRGKTVGIVDDIVGTGGTLLKSYDVVKKSGAKIIIALITHGLLDSGVKKAKNKFSKIYLANTINRKEANIDITSLIIDAIIGIKI